GKNIVGILPQGGPQSQFNPEGGPKQKQKGLDADTYIKNAFAKLTELKEWNTPVPPQPGRVILAGHSGADVALTEMLDGEKGPKRLGGLFLFDTMQDTGQEKIIWAALERRLGVDLGLLQDLAIDEKDPVELERKRLAFIQERGFRLFEAFLKTGFY